MTMMGGYVSEDDIDAELFGEPHQGTIRYLRERVERHAPRISGLLGGFLDDTREMFERYNGDRALRRIRTRLRQSSDSLRHDFVRPLRTIEDIQNAKPLMQRYVMANFVSRLLAERQEIDGYRGSHSVRHPERRGLRDPDFMRVIDGVLFDRDYHDIKTHDDEDAWVAYQNLFEAAEDERDLDIVEQNDILSTWDVLEAFYEAKKKDPTSILNENM